MITIVTPPGTSGVYAAEGHHPPRAFLAAVARHLAATAADAIPLWADDEVRHEWRAPDDTTPTPLGDDLLIRCSPADPGAVAFTVVYEDDEDALAEDPA
ncbi:hypothetical protein ACK8HX_02160 [Oryzobacter sp. R7]|uniref:hypothetical protein n=1 Tax=Oryzobacter faecalis TaxID=3388656 RepID=UPI00398D3AC9